MAETIRYKPGEAIRWLSTGAGDLRKAAQRQGKDLIDRKGDRTFVKDVKDAAGALSGMAMSAWAELKHRQLEASEILFMDDRFEVSSPTGPRSVRYTEVSGLKQKGDRLTLVLEKGSITIKPHAYIVSGSLKVPVGWTRNGVEVPYELLADELSARCGVNIEHL